MKEKLNQTIYSSILVSLAVIALGVFLLISPDISMKVIGQLVGIALLASGVISVVRYFVNAKKFTFLNLELIFGIGASFFGLFAITKSLMIIEFITMIFGIWILLSGIIKLEYAISLKNYKKDFWTVNLGISLITLFAGIMLIINPFKSSMLMTEIMGVFIIIYGLLDLLNTFIFKQHSDTIIKLIKNNEK